MCDPQSVWPLSKEESIAVPRWTKVLSVLQSVETLDTDQF